MGLRRRLGRGEAAAFPFGLIRMAGWDGAEGAGGRYHPASRPEEKYRVAAALVKKLGLPAALVAANAL